MFCAQCGVQNEQSFTFTVGGLSNRVEQNPVPLLQMMDNTKGDLTTDYADALVEADA